MQIIYSARTAALTLFLNKISGNGFYTHKTII